MKRFVNLLKRVIKYRKKVSSPEDLKEIIAEAEDEGVISEEEESLMDRVLKIENITVDKVVVPRVDMTCIRADTKIEKIMKVFIKKGYSRLPVYYRTPDEIIGMIYLKEILKFWNTSEDLRAIEFIRLPYFIPENKGILDTIRDFQNKKVSIALTVDEYGGISGLVTMEDLIEEIVGEMQDEIDREEKDYTLMKDGSYLINARMELEKFNQLFKKNFKAKDVHTVGGLIFAELERIPNAGETFILKGLHMKIVEASNHKINKIVIERIR